MTQLRKHGLDPSTELIEVAPRADKLLHTEDILRAIGQHHPRLAMVLLGGVNYLTGQVPLLSYTAGLGSAHRAGARDGTAWPWPWP